jgi:hypothetical protein
MMQVTITRTDDGANTKIKSPSGEASKDYASWDAALKEAESIGLINSVEAIGAKALPPGFPLRSNSDLDPSVVATNGFIAGKTSPAQ